MKTITSFLSRHDIMSLVVAYAIGSRISELTHSFFNDIIIPILNVDWNQDGESDRKQLSELTLNIGPIKIRYGNFILNLLNIVIGILVIFFIGYFVNTYFVKHGSNVTSTTSET